MINEQLKDPRALKKFEETVKLTVRRGTGISVNSTIPSGREGKIPLITTSSYKAIHENYIKTGKLWEDLDFPAESSSLIGSTGFNDMIKWMRPKEISHNPVFMLDGISRFDIKQEDNWFLSALASLVLHSEIISKIISRDQNFKNNYCGAFYFNFCYNGQWREVFVDDMLPTINTRLAYVATSNPNEFWSALMAKAYAKLRGSYEILSNIELGEALNALTGGLTEKIELTPDSEEKLKDILSPTVTKRSVITAVIIRKAYDNNDEKKLKNGLFGHRSYNITVFRRDIINNKGVKISLIKIRNPWGNAAEWTGAWRDRGPEWNSLSEEQKRALGIEFKDDGEFWMELKDFCKEFNLLYITHLNINSLCLEPNKDEQNIYSWQPIVVCDSWKSRVNAGGWENVKKSYWTNPQYRITILEDANTKNGMGTILINLQIQISQNKLVNNGTNLKIGYIIWKIKSPNARMDINFFTQQEKIFAANPISEKEIFGRHTLNVGEYYIVPSTEEPNQDRDFILQVYFETHQDSPLSKVTPVNRLVNIKPNGLPAPLTESQKDGLKKLHASVKGDLEGIYAQDLRKLMNEALKSEFNSINFEIKVIARKKNNYEPEDIEDENLITPEQNGIGPINSRFQKDISKDAQTKKSSSIINLFSCMSKGPVNTGVKFTLKPKVKELKSISLETARSLIACMDYDRSGYLNEEEFEDLWNILRLWRKVFVEYDADKTGTMNSVELKNALEATGYILDNDVYSCIVSRFANRNGELIFDDFLMCCARLKTSLDIFDALKDKNEKTAMEKSEYLASVLYL